MRDLIVIRKSLPKNVYRSKDSELEGTVLDPRLDTTGGGIQLPTNISLFNPDDAKVLGFRGSTTSALTARWMIKILPEENRSVLIERLINTTSDARHIYFPKKGNLRYNLENGMSVLTDIQRSADFLLQVIETWTKAAFGGGTPLTQYVQQGFSSYLMSVKAELCGKRGLIDQNAACVKAVTARAVAVNNWELPLNTAGIPSTVIDTWMKNRQFCDTYDLDINHSKEQNYKKLESSNFQVLLGRQPTHRHANLFAMKVKVLR